MEKRTVSGLMVAITIAAVAIFAGCVDENHADVDQVRAYADPITENILSGMSENNYSEYSSHFDPVKNRGLCIKGILESG